MTALPAVDERLRGQAASLASLSKRLMAHVAAPLLSISIDQAHGSPRIVAWSDRLEPCPSRTRALSAAGKAKVEMAAMRREASIILEALRQRWPAYATPARLGIVTDGSGIILSADEPDPLAPGWLGRHLTRDIILVELLRVEPSATLGRILAPGRCGQLN